MPHLAFQPDQLSDTPILPMDEVRTAYYLRLRAFDRPGVLADITRILADRSISIDAMVQKEPAEGEEQVNIILLTHITVEKNINAAIAKIEARRCVPGKVMRIRLEELAATDAATSPPAARGPATRSRSPTILLGGLAPDGGLAVPERYPRLSAAELAAMRGTELPRARLRGAVALHRRHSRRRPARADRQDLHRGDASARDDITPLNTLEPGLHVLALSNGPTLAFKDMAMQLLGNLFEYVLAKTGARAQHPRRDLGRHRLGSAEYAMRGKRGIRVFMLSPQGTA